MSTTSYTILLNILIIIVLFNLFFPHHLDIIVQVRKSSMKISLNWPTTAVKFICRLLLGNWSWAKCLRSSPEIMSLIPIINLLTVWNIWKWDRLSCLRPPPLFTWTWRSRCSIRAPLFHTQQIYLIQFRFQRIHLTSTISEVVITYSVYN